VEIMKMHQNIGDTNDMVPPLSKHWGDIPSILPWNLVSNSLVYIFRHCDWIDL